MDFDEAKKTLSAPTTTALALAKVLNVSIDVVYDGMNRGQIAHVKIGKLKRPITAPWREQLGLNRSADA